MTVTPNNTADVSNVKGVQGGYGFSAPLGTTLPTSSSPFATLASGFGNMGFISKDGLAESLETETEEEEDLNGDVVFVAKSTEKEKIVLTLIGTNPESLSEWYGHANVDTTGTSIAIQHKVIDRAARSYVFDLLLKDSRKWRKIVPNGLVTRVGEIVFAKKGKVSREIEITCLPDSSGVRIYDYIEKTTSGNAS
jgi:hypothetical protein